MWNWSITFCIEWSSCNVHFICMFKVHLHVSSTGIQGGKHVIVEKLQRHSSGIFPIEMFWIIFITDVSEFDFCLTVHHQLGKVILMNQLDATMIYWSIRSAQHVSGNILPIIRSVRLRYLQHMVSCCCGG